MNTDVVKSLVSALATALDVEIIRAEQGGSMPASDYGSYKVTLKNNEKYQDRRELYIPDPAKYKEEYSRKENFSISLSFISRTGVANIWTLADRAFDFLNVLSVDLKKSLNIYVEMLAGVTDRTTYIDPTYEYKVGFDFLVHGIGKLERVIDAVDIEGTIDGIVEVTSP
ncbi:MAG TPA: hypothetical protein PK079_25085 [Leptospiraceae bacterium]|nr:hypothetical protein [Leptospiraceae bacterium]HMW08593.1 hypothetical protein [Leptospiraceae bacterium]HMZ66552.1 hypothetical protein [Leptospiraceae bacterium]HNA10228.1 hypothetical protein [Leptospiraceae bacterium]HNB98556.1 hypothetical protein [Leptospiraceae bacterium]